MRFSNEVFTGDVTLDFNEFVDCELRDCTVFYHGGKFSLLRTKLTNVRFGFGGSANDTLNFIKMIRATNPKLVEDLLQQGDQPVAVQDKSAIN